MEVLAWLIAALVVVLGGAILFSVLGFVRSLKNYNKAIEKAMAKGDFSQAERIALRYVDSYPYDFILKYYLGQIYEAKKDYAKAIFYYEKAALLASSETDEQLRLQFYLRIADLYRKKQQYKEAIGYYALVLDKDPDNLKALFSAGECCYHLELYSKALEHLKHYVDLHPGNVKAYFLLGEVCNKLGKEEEALDAYETILSEYPTVDEVLTLKSMRLAAFLSLKTQNYQKAEQYFRKLLPIEDYYEEALVQLVELLVLTSRVDEAIRLVEDFEKKVSQMTRAQLFFHIGNGYFKQGLYYTALQVWKKGFQVNPNHPQLKELMGRYVEILENKGMEIFYGEDVHAFEKFIACGFPNQTVKASYQENHLWVSQIGEKMVVFYRAPFSFKEKEIATVESILKMRFNVAPFFTLYALYGIEGWDEAKIKQQNQVELISGKPFVQWVVEAFTRYKKGE